MQTFGECSFKLGGRPYTARASAELTNVGLETAVEGNIDGTVYQTAKTKPSIIKLDLEDPIEGTFSAADMVTPQDVTFVEEHRGVTHLYTGAKAIGEPQYAPDSGAITNISFGCQRANYRRVVG